MAIRVIAISNECHTASPFQIIHPSKYLIVSPNCSLLAPLATSPVVLYSAEPSNLQKHNYSYFGKSISSRLKE